MSAPTLTFVFPMPLNLANSRMHWRVKENKRQQFFAEADGLQLAGVIPPPPPQPFGRVVAKATLYLGSQMDDDNAFLRASKWPVDWLKTRGYISDDRKKNLRWTGVPVQRVKRDKNYRLEIVLTCLEVAR